MSRSGFGPYLRVVFAFYLEGRRSTSGRRGLQSASGSSKVNITFESNTYKMVCTSRGETPLILPRMLSRDNLVLSLYGKSGW
jgi:hypothetical protein